MKCGPVKTFLFSLLIIIVACIFITIYFHVVDSQRLSYYDELEPSKHIDDKNPIGIFIASEEDCWICCVFNILFRMKEFKDFLADIDEKTLSHEPFLKSLKDLGKKVYPSRKKHITLKDSGYGICNHLNSKNFKYGQRNFPVLFTKLLVQHLADFDTKSQYFVIHSRSSNHWVFPTNIIRSNRKKASISLLRDEIFVYTKTPYKSICEMDRKLHKNLRYPKILFIIPSLEDFIDTKSSS